MLMSGMILSILMIRLEKDAEDNHGGRDSKKKIFVVKKSWQHDTRPQLASDMKQQARETVGLQRALRYGEWNAKLSERKTLKEPGRLENAALRV